MKLESNNMTHKVDRLISLHDLTEIVEKIMGQYKISFPNEKEELNLSTNNYAVTVKKKKKKASSSKLQAPRKRHN